MLEPSTHPVVANGIIAGQYHAPIAEFIFPEQVVGSPVPPINVESIPFLACGGYILTAGALAGPLNPWPRLPPTICGGATATAPTAVVGATQTVASGATVSLNAGAGTGTAPLTFAWTQTGGTPVILTNANTAVSRFTVPTVAV